MPTLNQLACTPALIKANAMIKLTVELELDAELIAQAIMLLILFL